MDFISLSDLSNLPALPVESKWMLVAIGLVAFGYVCGRFDREPPVSVRIEIPPRETIAPLTAAELEARAVLGETVGKVAHKPITRTPERNAKGQFLPRRS